MAKFVLFFLGMLFISVGVVSWTAGALMPHDRVIIIIGALLVAAAVFLHRRQKMQEQ